MPTPKLDENIMVEALKQPPTVESLRALQTGAFMLIIDAYDRKVTRDMMLTTASAATSLLAELGKLFIIEQMRNVSDVIQGVSPTQIEEARQGLIANMQAVTRDALAMAELLKQCPNDEDKVH